MSQNFGIVIMEMHFTKCLGSFNRSPNFDCGEINIYGKMYLKTNINCK